MFKQKLNKLKTWYATQFKEKPMETLASTLSLVAAALGLAYKVQDGVTRSRNSKTWEREVKRREKLNK